VIVLTGFMPVFFLHMDVLMLGGHGWQRAVFDQTALYLLLAPKAGRAGATRSNSTIPEFYTMSMDGNEQYSIK
jgi:hypothetical protein